MLFFNEMRLSILAFFALILAQSCRDKSKLFRLVSSDESGINFTNSVNESDTLNALTFDYIYNGAGVGTADFNNDGLTDVFFAGNLTSSRLFLNKGKLKFEDVTSQAGIGTTVWCTGISIVDINEDGFLDVYVSTIHPDISKQTQNIFFINQGIDKNGVPRFKNLAMEMGVADLSYSTQATFLDFDLDGDLDMYLLTNSLENFSRNSPVGARDDGKSRSVDKLYRNDKSADSAVHFTDVSANAGILAEGWGLGVVVNDFNQDGWPDIYCANDFLSSDHLYINNQNGTFSNQIGGYMNHQEFNGMGVDMADLNNDALNDIVVVDMMPDDNERQKTMFSNTAYDRFTRSTQLKYQTQYVRNVLQRNNGNNTFSDIGYQTGIYATDWSWSALLADFDNDGFRDILLTNGYPKDITNMDFITYHNEASRFGTDELKRKKMNSLLKDLTGVNKPNFLFQNKGDFRFENVAERWGLSEIAFSNGAAYADFDNDGDLDLVVNNLNSKSFLYENQTEHDANKSANSVRILFQGTKANPQGIGSKLWIYSGKDVHYAEQQLQRGYLSSVDPIMHVGLGAEISIDSIIVVWPDRRTQTILDIKVNTVVKVSHSKSNKLHQTPEKKPTLLVEDSSLPQVVQSESDYIDFKYAQRTLPHKFSQQGPCLTAGDINGDNLEDFIMGGTAHHSAKIFLQQANGQFKVDSLPAKEAEDIGILLFDADNDGDKDLYCVSGSSEFGANSSQYQDRMYTNDGKGNFVLNTTALPKTESSGSCVIAADFDKDNDLDLFVGGRVVPMSYPVSPRSYILRNDGKGKFEDATISLGAELDSVGMVTCAVFSDFDNDGWKDLIVAGEWMPICFFRNVDGRFTKVKELNTGWWSSLAEGDFDKDGDMDYVAGNVGKNSILQATLTEPVSIYAKDFDKNGSLDPIISRYLNHKEYPIHPRETMTDQIVGLRRLFRSYAQYGAMEMPAVLKFLGEDGMIVKRADYLESAYIENSGDGNFSLKALPSGIQVSPLNSLHVSDLNADGNLDFIAVGNSFSEETLFGNYDSGIGVYALGSGKGSFTIVDPATSGFCVMTDAKTITPINVQGKRNWIISSNQSPVKMFSPRR